MFRHPFTSLVAGPTGAGKTRWIQKFIGNVDKMMSPPPQRIIYCYGEWQTLFNDMYGSVEFVSGLPDLEELDSRVNNLIVLDDLMNEADESVSKLFTKISHHRNTSVIFLVQNLFPKNKEFRTISLNSHYIVVFKNVRDKTQITNLAKQMYPGNIKYLQSAYLDATTEPFKYLLIDLKPDTLDSQRLLTNVFPEEGLTCCYVPK